MSTAHSAPRTVYEAPIEDRLIRVERIDWASGGSSFDAYDAATGTCLTEQESFDTLPGTDDLAGLLEHLCPNAFDDDYDTCQLSADGGEGWNGYCGTCADRREAQRLT